MLTEERFLYVINQINLPKIVDVSQYDREGHLTLWYETVWEVGEGGKVKEDAPYNV